MIELLIRAAATELLSRPMFPVYLDKDAWLAAVSLAFWPNPNEYFQNRNLS